MILRKSSRGKRRGLPLARPELETLKDLAGDDGMTLGHCESSDRWTECRQGSVAVGSNFIERAGWLGSLTRNEHRSQDGCGICDLR